MTDREKELEDALRNLIFHAQSSREATQSDMQRELLGMSLDRANAALDAPPKT